MIKEGSRGGIDKSASSSKKRKRNESRDPNTRPRKIFKRESLREFILRQVRSGPKSRTELIKKLHERNNSGNYKVIKYVNESVSSVLSTMVGPNGVLKRKGFWGERLFYLPKEEIMKPNLTRKDEGKESVPLRVLIEAVLRDFGPLRKLDLKKKILEKIKKDNIREPKKIEQALSSNLSLFVGNGRITRSGAKGKYEYMVVEEHLLPESAKLKKRGRKKKKRRKKKENSQLEETNKKKEKSIQTKEKSQNTEMFTMAKGGRDASETVIPPPPSTPPIAQSSSTLSHSQDSLFRASPPTQLHEVMDIDLEDSVQQLEDLEHHHHHHHFPDDIDIPDEDEDEDDDEVEEDEIMIPLHEQMQPVEDRHAIGHRLDEGEIML